MERVLMQKYDQEIFLPFHPGEDRGILAQLCFFNKILPVWDFGV